MVGAIASALGAEGVSIEQMVQEGRAQTAGGAVPVCLLTHASREGSVQKALSVGGREGLPQASAPARAHRGRVTRAEAPLGVFDSGLGGLTVARAILEALPHERIVYLGDTARVPYGTRSPETVIRYARGCAKVLIERGVKALVIACNTVSAVALDLLRAELDLPVIGVIEPGAETAVRALASLPAEDAQRKVGVLGTAGTIASNAYPRAVALVSTRVEVVGQAAPLLVPLVEEGWLEGECRASPSGATSNPWCAPERA